MVIINMRSGAFNSMVKEVVSMIVPSTSGFGFHSDDGNNFTNNMTTVYQSSATDRDHLNLDPNGSIPFSKISQPACQWILYWEINYSRVRIWDVMILIPNALFLAFLLLKLKSHVVKLKASSSPIFMAFYGLVCAVSIISVMRCIVSMTVNASVESGDLTDKMLWLILRFFLLSTEASVIVFGIYFGHLDSKTSIRRVLACTSFFALAYSATQGTLEIKLQHKTINVQHGNTTDSFDLFAHGGMIFLCASSAFFCLVYFIILILPLTRIKEKFILPSKPTFYYYVATLAVLNLTQAVGSLLLYQHVNHALCVIDVTTYCYFTLFDPLVYGTFLWKFFRTTQSGILFSYNQNVQEDSQLSLPSQAAVNKAMGDAAISEVFGSTHFDQASRPPTPYLNINNYYHAAD